MQKLYQLDYQSAPWHTYRYTIKNTNIPLYQVRRTGFRKYRQFEDVNNKILFYIGKRTIKSIDNEKILANIQIDEKIIETKIGNFTLTDLDLSQRSYILKMNGNIVAQVTKKCRLSDDRYIIEIENINEQHQTFIFALLILINSILETIQSPIICSHSIHMFPNFHVKNYSSL